MALKLSLKPDERLVINGAVIANGDRRTTLVVQNKASILREKDIMQEEEITTPARHVYFPVMLMYMDEKNFSEYYEAFMVRMTEFMGAITSPEVTALCVSISHEVMAKNYYKALMNCKKLIAYEEAILNPRA